MIEDPVVVVGAGPAGLVATIALARAGVDVLLLERRDSGSPLPRATVLSLRSMELLRSWGLERQVLDVADDVEMTMLAMPGAARVSEGVVVEVGYPDAARGAGLNLRTSTPSAEVLRDAVRRLIDDERIRASSRRIAEDYARHDAPRRAADLIEALASTERPGKTRSASQHPHVSSHS